MGIVSAAADALVAVVSLTIAVAAPLIDAQAVLPHTLYPAPLLDLKRWYAAEFGDYLMDQPPGFFRGLVCLELAFQWPLAVATLYGILTRRRWAATTTLMSGVVTLTAMSAVLGELLGSGKATPKLLQLYAPFVVFAVIAIFVDFAQALDALPLVHHLDLLPGRRGSRSGILRDFFGFRQSGAKILSGSGSYPRY